MFNNFHTLTDTIQLQIIKEFQIFREGFILEKKKMKKKKNSSFGKKPLRREAIDFDFDDLAEYLNKTTKNL